MAYTGLSVGAFEFAKRDYSADNRAQSHPFALDAGNGKPGPQPARAGDAGSCERWHRRINKGG